MQAGAADPVGPDDAHDHQARERRDDDRRPPVAAAFTARGIPTLLTGFGVDEDNIHSPNERLEVRRFEWALRSAREIYLALAALPAG